MGRCWPTSRPPRSPTTAPATTAPSPPRPIWRRGGPTAPTGTPPGDCEADLLAMLADPSWVYRQYDHQLFLNTVEGPGGDAALLRLGGPGLPPSPAAGSPSRPTPTPAGARSTPGPGTALVVAEARRQPGLRRGAGRSRSSTACNFGNPEHPEVMWQLSEAIDGMAEACLAFGLPVIGGNVSLYNESGGADIPPTPGDRRARARGGPRAPAARDRLGGRRDGGPPPSRGSAGRAGRQPVGVRAGRPAGRRPSGARRRVAPAVGRAGP